jgi:hypothetical protein
MLNRNAHLAVLLVIVVEISAGCGGRRGTVPVEGRVTLDKKPLVGATVMFAPTTANGPGPFVGTTDEQGQFKLGLFESSTVGAAVGEYNVVIATIKSRPSENSTQLAKEIVPAEYRNGLTKYRVSPGGTKAANFDLKSR